MVLDLFGGTEHNGDLRIDWGGQYGGVISISVVLETGPLYRPGPTEISPYRGKLMGPYGSTTARHQLFLFIEPISYVAFFSVSTYARCTRRLIWKKIFFCSRRRLKCLIEIKEKRNSRNLARSFLNYPCTINNYNCH